MKELKLALLKTLLHTLELIVVFAAVYAAIHLLNLPLDETLSGLVIASLVKFARSYEQSPIGDYVNSH